MSAWPLRLVGVFGLVCIGCGGGSVAPTETTSLVVPVPAEATDLPLPGRALTTEEARSIEPLLEAAQRIRGLRFRSPVPTRVQTQQEITEFVRSHLDRDELEHARIFYLALGMLPADLDVEASILAVMGEQIVGYYDPDDRLMVVRDDVLRDLRRSTSGAAPDQGAIVLVHEYVHALQDQHLGLHDMQHADRDIDGDNAFGALVEGDATLAMFGWIVSAQGHRLSDLTRDPSTLRTLVRNAPNVAGGAELASAPAIVRAPLLSRYVDGLIFCATLHGRGGFRWIDEAFASLPTSTEQVLHPERWLRHEEPERFELPAFPELERAGYAVHDEDTLGELETSIYLAMGTSHDRDETAGEGWAGDRIRVYVDGPRTAAIWFTLWDSERDAIEVEHAAQRVAAHQASSTRTDVMRQGRAVLIGRDLPAAQDGPIHSRFRAFAAAHPALDAPRSRE